MKARHILLLALLLAGCAPAPISPDEAAVIIGEATAEARSIQDAEQEAQRPIVVIQEEPPAPLAPTEAPPLDPPFIPLTYQIYAVTVQAESLNIRAGPGPEYDSLGIAPAGTVLWLYLRDKPTRWLGIETAEGMRGWVSGSEQYVSAIHLHEVDEGSYTIYWEAVRELLDDPLNQDFDVIAGCHTAYPDVCLEPPPPDLDCSQIAHRRFRVLPPDPHLMDEDGDGVGCEVDG